MRDQAPAPGGPSGAGAGAGGPVLALSGPPTGLGKGAGAAGTPPSQEHGTGQAGTPERGWGARQGARTCVQKNTYVRALWWEPGRSPLRCETSGNPAAEPEPARRALPPRVCPHVPTAVSCSAASTPGLRPRPRSLRPLPARPRASPAPQPPRTPAPRSAPRHAGGLCSPPRMRSPPALAALLVLALPLALARPAAPPGPAPPAQGTPVAEPPSRRTRGSPAPAVAALLQLLREEAAGAGRGGRALGAGPARPGPPPAAPRPRSLPAAPRKRDMHDVFVGLMGKRAA
ncbi:uncharacterized protein VSU04_015614 [Chlamydotis macqueenii]